MQGKLINGKAIAKKIKQELKVDIEDLKSRGVIPGLAAVLVGDDPASQLYVNSKAKTASKLGLFSEVIKRDADISQNDLVEIVNELNNRDDIHGILVQSPLPKHINEMDITLTLDPLKDVDAFHPMNMGHLLIGEPIFLPCTPFGVIKMIDDINVDPKGKKVVVLGRSNIVGKPLAVMLMQKWQGCNATVTVCHTGTANIPGETIQADIIIAAIGRANFVTADMIKEGAIIIDVGQNQVEDKNAPKGYKLCGDVDFDGCLEKASMITPVPGGVGPMTIAMLMYNTVRATKLKLVYNK
ncbi:MAG: bifunctional 5,10-methylenetetrahydrofolate dehydrogenase/5,10-methenyltetrahydrofolate cyclohydrolase [candidate division Zixibacteria bacterium]